MKKSIIWAGILIILLLGGSGCMFKYPKENINAVALNYMEQKYGEKFEYYAPFGDSMTGTHQLIVRCDSFPDQNIVVRIENYRKDDKVFLDNYVAVKYHDDTENFLRKCVEQVFSEANVFFDIDTRTLPPELGVDASLEDYLSDTTVPFHFYTEVKASNFTSKDQVDKLSELVSKYGSRYYLLVLISEDSEPWIDSTDAFKDRIFYKKYIYLANSERLSDEIEITWYEEE